MLGAICGDVIGSVFEPHNQRIKREDFALFSPGSRFTDDTVLTVATADAILHGLDYGTAYQTWGRRYPNAGFSRAFRSWFESEFPKPYESLGNGAAMRVSPVGWACSSIEEVLFEAERTALPSHNHPEGIKGAQATAVAVFLARTGASKEEIRTEIEQAFGYSLRRALAEIRPGYAFDSTCPGSVPEGITAFLESEDYEDAVRKAISLGGDSDTLACIAGAIAEAYYHGVPAALAKEVSSRLPPEMIGIIDEFQDRFLK